MFFISSSNIKYYVTRERNIVVKSVYCWYYTWFILEKKKKIHFRCEIDQKRFFWSKVRFASGV